MASEMLEKILEAENAAKKNKIQAEETARRIVSDAESKAREIVESAKKNAAEKTADSLRKCEKSAAVLIEEKKNEAYDDCKKFRADADKKRNDCIASVVKMITA